MALNPQQDVYIDFLNYDWDSFTEYRQGLDQILQNYLHTLQESDANVREIPLADRQQLINQAQSFFYCNHTGNIIELDSYMQWKAVNGDKYLKNKNITEVTDATPASAPAPAEQAPSPPPQSTAEAAPPQSTAEAAPNTPLSHHEPPLPSQPPYSSNYQELVELILSGKQVPGIKQIPDTVLPEQESKPTAARRAKPWEK